MGKTVILLHTRTHHTTRTPPLTNPLSHYSPELFLLFPHIFRLLSSQTSPPLSLTSGGVAVDCRSPDCELGSSNSRGSRVAPDARSTFGVADGAVWASTEGSAGPLPYHTRGVEGRRARSAGRGQESPLSWGTRKLGAETAVREERGVEGSEKTFSRTLQYPLLPQASGVVDFRSDLT